MTFGVIGTSIWQQNMALLERLTLDRETREEELKRLKNALGLDELIYLATCNRVEFLYVSPDENVERLLPRLVDFFFRGGRDISFFPNDFYQYRDRDAITHVFRTVASLESLVIGETQISGQFKQACQDCSEIGLVGPYLKKLADEALVLSKRVRSETSLVNGSLSMAALATAELKSLSDSDREPVIALVGAGEMTVKLANYISETKLGRILFVNRTIEKAEQLARRFGAEAVSLKQFRSAPPAIDAVISATAAREAIFDAEFVAAIPESVENVICIDLAIPRDFSLELAAHSRVKMIDIPYLKKKGNANLRRKFVEAGKANSIVREFVEKFLSERVSGSLKPIFQDSYRESLELAGNAFDDLFATRVTSLSSQEKEAVLRLVKKLIGHSSFQPARMISERLVQADADLNLDRLSQLLKKAV